jgi:hypothetical protein
MDQHVSNPLYSQSNLLAVIDTADSPPQLEAVLRVEARGPRETYADVSAMEAT